MKVYTDGVKENKKSVDKPTENHFLLKWSEQTQLQIQMRDP